MCIHKANRAAGHREGKAGYATHQQQYDLSARELPAAAGRRPIARVDVVMRGLELPAAAAARLGLRGLQRHLAVEPRPPQKLPPPSPLRWLQPKQVNFVSEELDSAHSDLLRPTHMLPDAFEPHRHDIMLLSRGTFD